jgi:hypothetical protein
MSPVLTSKIHEAEEIVRKTLQTHSEPVIAWSSGKDSMCLLHIIMFRMGIKMPVICYREPWMPDKLDFTNTVIRHYGLEAWDYSPCDVALRKGNGRIDVLNSYQIGASTMQVARGTEPPGTGPFLCGVETFLRRPRGTFAFPWGIIFHGHKSCDIDPCAGPVPLKVDVKLTPGSATAAFPVRNFTDDEIFEYLEENDCPIDPGRYLKVGEKWTVLEDKRNSPDYYPTCFKCCDPENGEFVRCPKYNWDMPSLSGSVKWETPNMPYCGLKKGKRI